jgi:hypothetical protein
MIPRNDQNSNDSLNMVNAAAIFAILALVTSIGLPEPLIRVLGIGFGIGM